MKYLEKAKSSVLDPQKGLKSSRDSLWKDAEDDFNILSINSKINDMRLWNMREVINYILKNKEDYNRYSYQGKKKDAQSKQYEIWIETIDSLEKKIYKIRDTLELQLDYNVPKGKN